MSEAAEDTKAQLRLVWDPDAPSATPEYANYVQMNFTPEDFTMYFGWYSIPPLREPPPDGVLEVGVRPVAQVTIPLNLMVNLIALLERQAEGYEENFGPLPEHPNKPDWLKEKEADSTGGEDG